MLQALHKANKAHESVDNYVLMEEVQKSWDKRQQEKSTTQRILEDDECPLMAQSRWQGDGRFILKKVADALVKARRAEDPNNFVLVEEVEYPSTTTESTPLGSSVRRRGPYRDRRVLYDHENVYEVQAQWTAKGLFELRDRNESPDSSLRHSEPVACQEPGPSQEICEEPASSGRRQVHSEGETLSDDETQEPPSAVSRLRKISFRKLKVWR
ncbi:hypothetical protein IscW_ISCW009316 [Ixodes scapularis]|uniref:Ras-associating domain-containing protein n=1 Tax=Ixodes scapularis TaxID=6945 RepID=B7PYJ3_IXOSC|nr:hypothetical protein IscW_ISCW009316 [Ixodes scapularis]|eukprot:XP_002403175.1 hypothetical protein IscW_ISCW009316 [Ixodes scapularis]